jgi:hypothetical protein
MRELNALNVHMLLPYKNSSPLRGRRKFYNPCLPSGITSAIVSETKTLSWRFDNI